MAEAPGGIPPRFPSPAGAKVRRVGQDPRKPGLRLRAAQGRAARLAAREATRGASAAPRPHLVELAGG